MAFNWNTPHGLVYLGIRSNKPVFFKGMPGGAKSAIIESVTDVMNALPSAEYGVHLAALNCAHMDVGDLGTMLPDDTGYDLIPARMFLKAKKEYEATGKQLVLFLDEIAETKRAVQAMLHSVLNERRIGELDMRKFLRIVAAYNPTESSTTGGVLSPALLNRGCQLDWPDASKEWRDWLASNRTPGYWRPPAYVSDAEIETARQRCDAVLAGFLSRFPDVGRDMAPAEGDDALKPYATKRSIVNAMDMLATCEAHGAQDDVSNLMMIGCCGLGFTKQFNEYREKLDIPDFAELAKWYSAGREKGEQMYQLAGAREDLAFTVMVGLTSHIVSKLRELGTAEPKKREGLWTAGWAFAESVAHTHSKSVAAHGATALVQLYKKDKIYVMPNAAMMGKLSEILREAHID